MSEYDTDILLWSERQAELLRRRAAGDLEQPLRITDCFAVPPFRRSDAGKNRTPANEAPG
ncbi:MAG TPA: hypothetical protein VGI78_01850 [Acetobacteraceae bacterium]|jgi:hypothetical protein